MHALEALFRQSVAAVDGRALARRAAADLGAPRVLLCGAGKAAAAMAAGIEDALGERVAGGLVVVKAGHAGPPLRRVRVLEAAHPVPDARSEAAAGAMLDTLASCPSDAEVVFVLSGGTSALLAAPLDGLTLADLAAANRALVHGGVPIEEINAVRRRLQRAAGGRLALACARPVHVLVLSDVLGNPLASIGSGPFHGDSLALDGALRVAAAAPGFPAVALDALARAPDPPRPGDPRLSRVRHTVLADHAALLAAAAAAAQRQGRHVELLPPASDDVEAVAARLGALPSRPGGVLYVGGGEPTVQVPRNAGAGGRAQHLALLMALHLEGREAAFLAAGSDGSDGDTPATGGVVTGATCALARRRGLDLVAATAGFDSHRALGALDALVVTGPTGTNLLDLHLLRI